MHGQYTSTYLQGLVSFINTLPDTSPSLFLNEKMTTSQNRGKYT
jgi:hypothetical protein